MSTSFTASPPITTLPAVPSCQPGANQWIEKRKRKTAREHRPPPGVNRSACADPALNLASSCAGVLRHRPQKDGCRFLLHRAQPWFRPVSVVVPFLLQTSHLSLRI